MGAHELVKGFASQLEGAGFFTEGFHPRCLVQFLDSAGAQFWALFFCAAGAVEAVDEGPVEVAAGVEAPVAGDEDHGAVGGGVDADFEEEGAVAFHAVEFPAVTEGVEEEMEAASRIGPVKVPGLFAKVAFEGHAAADDAMGVLELFDVEVALEFGPFGGELLVLEEGFFLFVEFGGLFEHFFVAAGFDVVLEGGDDGLGLRGGRVRKEMEQIYDS